MPAATSDLLLWVRLSVNVMVRALRAPAEVPVHALRHLRPAGPRAGGDQGHVRLPVHPRIASAKDAAGFHFKVMVSKP